MSFHSTDESCRFRSFAEAERYCERIAPIRKWYAKRMCAACRRRQVYGKARFCDNAECVRKRVLKAKDRSFAHSAPSTYVGS